jgi:ketosteroid isomerase-like protein
VVVVAAAAYPHDADIHIEPVEIEVHGDWAFARSAVTGTVTLQDSREVVAVDVKQIVIYRKGDDGRWKIARLIGNSNTE